MNPTYHTTIRNKGIEVLDQAIAEKLTYARLPFLKWLYTDHRSLKLCCDLDYDLAELVDHYWNTKNIAICFGDYYDGSCACIVYTDNIEKRTEILAPIRNKVDALYKKCLYILQELKDGNNEDDEVDEDELIMTADQWGCTYRELSARLEAHGGKIASYLGRHRVERIDPPVADAPSTRKVNEAQF